MAGTRDLACSGREDERSGQRLFKLSFAVVCGAGVGKVQQRWIIAWGLTSG
jgi:hypothetical protein